MRILTYLFTTLITLYWTKGNPEGDLDKLQQDFSNWLFSENPVFATSIDIHKYDYQIDDYSVETFDRWKNAVDGYLQKLSTIPRDSLTEKYTVDYDIFKDFLQTYVDGYKWKEYNSLNPMNFLEGPQIDPDYLVGITPKDTLGDFENFISRIEKMPTQLQQMISRFARAVQLDHTYHNVSIFKVAGQIDKGITSRPEDFSFYAPFKQTLDNITSISPSDKTQMRSKAKTAIQQYFTGLRNMKSYLEGNYSQHLRQGYGVSNWKQGSEYYKSVLQWHTSLPLTPEEVHQKGLDEVDRISKEMKKIMTRLGYSGTVKEVFTQIKNDSRFYLKTGDEILAKFNDIIHKQIEPKLPLMFKNLPDLPVEVQPMPNDGPGGQYISAAADGSRPGVFQVNLMHPDEMVTIGFMSLSLHETNPGHHLQISVQQLSEIPDFRRYGVLEKYFQAPALFPFYTAYVEGWALYAESLGEELGLYEDDYQLLGRYSSEVFRACRLVVDTGLHYMNWTRDQAVNYMLTYTEMGEHDTRTEIDRYLTWPGQACSYKIGELKIKELRKKATDELGDLFDIRDFHAVVLENGAVPLSVLEVIVDNWIEEIKVKNTRTSEYPTEDLEKLQDEFSDWLLSRNPGIARSLNIHTYDDEIKDVSLQAFDDLEKGISNYLLKLSSIPRSALSDRHKVDFDIFKDTLQTYIDGYKWRLYGPLNPINSLEGPQTEPEYETSVLPANMTLRDYESFITRIQLYPRQIEDFKKRMELAVKLGRTNHNVSMYSVPKRFTEINITSPPEDFPLYKPFGEELDNITTITADKKSDLRNRSKMAIQKYLDSLIDMKNFIENTYMKHLRTGYGVSAWDNGSDFYKACLRFHLSLPMTPEEVHEKGKSEVHRISAQIQKIFEKLNLTGTVKEVFDSLKNDTRFLLSTSEEMLVEYKDVVHNRVTPKLKTFFKNLPSLPVEVKPSGTDGIGGYYRQGPPDGSRPGIFFVNTFHPDKSPTFTFADLALHEAVPGHHLQLSYQSTGKIPGFRQWMGVDPFYNIPAAVAFYSAYVEGWALYAESLGEEMGVYKDDYELLGRYSAEIFRACRLVVDTGLHYYNWTQERAINYMLNYTAYGEKEITTEVNRYITWPGQACAYKTGELKIKELRARAENALGNKFDIKEFHLVVLQNGAMPLTTLETVVDTWIDQQKTSEQKSTESLEDKLTTLENSFSEWILYENPQYATLINDRRYDDRLDDLSVEALDRWKDQADMYMKQLMEIPRNSLSSQLKVDYDIFHDFLHTYVHGYEWKMYSALNPINFLEGPQSDPDNIVKKMPKYTKGDFENFITRIKNMPKQLHQIKSRLMKAIETNHTYNKVSIEPVPQMIDKMITERPENFVYYKPFTTDLDKIASLDNAEKEEMRSKAKSAIIVLNDSFLDLKKFINETYMQHLRPEYGVSGWDNGSEFYKACLKWHTSLSLTPEEVHKRGKEEVERISLKMKQIFTKMGISGSVKEGFATLKNDSKYFLKTGDDVVSAFNDIIHGQIEPKLHQLFKDIPDLPLIVEPMANNGPGGTYQNGAPDGSKPGTFQVNVFHPEEFPTFTFMSLALHETVPGHHLQISIQSLAKMAGFRKYGLDDKYFQPPTLFPFYTAFVEGWALYSEYLGEEMGLYNTDAMLLGRYSDEIFRACRLVVDTGLHYFNWTRERAIEYMGNYTAAGENERATEIDRYLTWPGQACAYKIGEMKIKELRQKATTELGAKFDIKDFHSVVLRNGPMPLSTLETVVDNWIQDVKRQKTISKPTSTTKTNGSDILHPNLLIYIFSSAILYYYHFIQK